MESILDLMMKFENKKSFKKLCKVIHKLNDIEFSEILYEFFDKAIHYDKLIDIIKKECKVRSINFNERYNRWRTLMS